MNVKFDFTTKEWHEFFRQNVIRVTGLDPDKPMEIRQGDVSVEATLINVDDMALDGSTVPNFTFALDGRAVKD